MTYTTPKRGRPSYPWRRVDAAARRSPGIWLQLPADAPRLVPDRLARFDRYLGAFEPPAVFEVRGSKAGAQAIRYCGEADYDAFYAALPTLGADTPPLSDFPRFVAMDEWIGLRAWSPERRPGFTTLPLVTATLGPLVLEEVAS